jgi:hypothetical protein
MQRKSVGLVSISLVAVLSLCFAGRAARGSVPLASSIESVSLPALPETLSEVVFAVVAGPPAITTAPPLIRSVPDASRLTTIALSAKSPLMLNSPVLRVDRSRDRKHLPAFHRLQVPMHRRVSSW